ncbi:MZA anti-phage system associated PD-(D/E)XK motif protein MzaD [Shewanella sp. DW31]|uniref:MZA anti-phage system associated PD-(D/E)XK motif protein MzaD n=1 Tax=Shewanella sp. DW31 TaxID=2699422 RepID=UPI0018E2B756|nr:MZA anti-phage system associated PD-(D/E)XK motif protein MzaD [Shewanella sp. DW31]MBI1676080.1 PD-(D/E)XK motif protein [Shewanella sp. DW31]
MALLTKDEISLAWRALTDDGEDVGWRSIPLSTHSTIKLQAARRFPGNEEALLIGFTSLRLPHFSSLPQGKGFRVILAELGDSSCNWLGLVRQPQGSLDLFTMMSADIVSTLAASHSCNENQLFQLFFGRIRAWQLFMARDAVGLRPEVELGLVGELTCLEDLLNAGLPNYMALESWVGPLDGLQDFELGSGAIEVKSTLASSGFRATIQSLEQLDDSVRAPLFVCGCRYRIAEEGTTLPERVRRLLERFETDETAAWMLSSSLLQIGYTDAHSDLYSRKFIDVETVYLLVDQGFPRLTVGNVPFGVRSARYEIDLDNVGKEKYSIHDVVNLIKGI